MEFSKNFIGVKITRDQMITNKFTKYERNVYRITWYGRTYLESFID